MTRHKLGIIAVLIVAWGVPVAVADPIDLTTYTINFTGIGLLPAAGSFTYDPDTPNFTNFLVTFNGVIFNLTSSANAPSTGTTFPSCIGGATGAAASFALLSGACAPPPPGLSTGWGQNSAGGFTEFGFFAAGSFTNDIDVFQVILAPPDFPEGNSGGWTLTKNVSSVPEPSTLFLLSTGLLSVAIVARKRIAPGTHQGTRTNR